MKFRRRVVMATAGVVLLGGLSFGLFEKYHHGNERAGLIGSDPMILVGARSDFHLLAEPIFGLVYLPAKMPCNRIAAVQFAC